ncbi:MAG TPA: hypothetical protein VM582_07360 [Candidatus Thermoplasmatota archaeon]|nr:hypothetical protein [Candidatus Thermoplasmatota archaeon]
MKLAPLVVALLLAGCAAPQDEGSPASRATPGAPPAIGPPLRFAGEVVDARTGEAIPTATVRIDLSQALPCGRQGVGWTSWNATNESGRFGPLEVPRPRSDDVAFFLHARAPGYSPNATFIGPTQARGDLGNLTVVLHPEASVVGTAPPGTLVALDAPTFPRVVAAAADGTFAFPQARVAPALLVAGTDVPYRALVRPPAQVDVPRVEARGWVLEGSVKGPTGAPLAADVIAWNGSDIVGVARSGASGAFSLPLAPEPAALRIEARTSDNHYGGVLLLDVNGPPALRETILAKALC